MSQARRTDCWIPGCRAWRYGIWGHGLGFGVGVVRFCRALGARVFSESGMKADGFNFKLLGSEHGDPRDFSI